MPLGKERTGKSIVVVEPAITPVARRSATRASRSVSLSMISKALDCNYSSGRPVAP